MSLEKDLSKYESIKESYNKNIIEQNYRYLGVCKELDKGIYFKFCYDKNRGINVNYLLEVGSGSYENPTKLDLDIIKKEFGDLKQNIESKNEEEISQIVESFDSIPKLVLI